ncbi:hypothetical protein PRIPAC_74193, partial [Pristionchus pacificus]|uniref:VWA domain-containing protein n=1 Tax=Pristionchus pacificus TaxID=54126 RepID=A0A2A6CAK0_PRIPA
MQYFLLTWSRFWNREYPCFSNYWADFVMLLDISASISKEDFLKMINFISEFLTFIDVDRTENRFSLIDFDAVAHLIIPLVPKDTTQEMMGLMKAKEHDDSGS